MLGGKKGLRELRQKQICAAVFQSPQSHGAFIIQTLCPWRAILSEKQRSPSDEEDISEAFWIKNVHTEQKIQIFLQMLRNYRALSGAQSKRILT